MTYFNRSKLTKNLRAYVKYKLKVGYKIKNRTRYSITNVIGIFM